MCHDLCVLKSFQTTNCPTFHSGKEIVFEADFRESVPVVIKSKSLDLESEGENIVSWTDENGDIGRDGNVRKGIMKSSLYFRKKNYPRQRCSLTTIV